MTWRVQRDQPGLPNLAWRTVEHAPGQVDVVAVEADRLPDAHAGGRQQADQRLVGRRPQRRLSQLGRRLEQRGDLGRRNTGKALARLRPAGQQAGRRISAAGSVVCR